MIGHLRAGGKAGCNLERFWILLGSGGSRKVEGTTVDGALVSTPCGPGEASRGGHDYFDQIQVYLSKSPT